MAGDMRHIPWNKGKKMSKEYRETVSRSLIGSKRHTKPHTEETKRKISEAKKGRPGPNLGRHFSLTARMNMSKSQRKIHKPKRFSARRRRRRIMEGLEYREWRKNVFERDGYRCQVCGVIGTYLEAHHIKGFWEYPKLRLSIDNGVTLCKECHKKTDNYKGRAKKHGTR